MSNLIVDEDWSAYRTQMALTSLILLYCFFALRGYVQVLRSKMADRVFITVLSGAAAISVSFAAYNTLSYFAVPQAVELRLLRSQLTRRDVAHARKIYVIGSTWQDSIAPTVRYDEFGLPFSAQPWAPGSAVYVVLRELDPKASGIPIQVVPGDVSTPIQPDALIVDMRKLKDFR